MSHFSSKKVKNKILKEPYEIYKDFVRNDCFEVNDIDRLSKLCVLWIS